MSTQAGTLQCPNCGAPAQSDATGCRFCGSRLATVACPSCFGMMFLGSRHCPHCGAAAARAAAGEPEAALRCPRCRGELAAVRVGAAPVRECPACSGLWLDADVFEQVCADREQQAAVLHFALERPAGAQAAEPPVRYVPCPRCEKLMNRINFRRYSGVIVDVCKPHGTWFDRDELRKIVEFIRGGGLDQARERDRQRLEEERRRLESAQRDLALSNAFRAPPPSAAEDSLDELFHRVLRFIKL